MHILSYPCPGLWLYTGSMIRKIIVFLGSIIASCAAGAIGSLATASNIPTWYAALEKPTLNPPNEVFGPVWTVLYVLMGVALALVILEHTKLAKKSAYCWFGIQLALNAAWSFVFFGLHMPELGIVVILLLLASILMTIRAFYGIKTAAAWLLLPYIGWVSFATYLTVAIAILN